MKTKHNWESVDWSLDNKQIATRKQNAKKMGLMNRKKKPSPEQLAMVRDWEKRNPERAQARKNAWAKSPAGKKWLAKNQKKKNKRRDAWRLKKRREAKRALRRSNAGTQRGRDDDAPPATETRTRHSLK